MNGHTDQAVAAVVEMARAGHDVAGWLAGVLASAAAELGGSYEVLAGRPGSWEAALVRQLLAGTVGHDDQYLHHYGPAGSDGGR